MPSGGGEEKRKREKKQGWRWGGVEVGEGRGRKTRKIQKIFLDITHKIKKKI